MHQIQEKGFFRVLNMLKKTQTNQGFWAFELETDGSQPGEAKVLMEELKYSRRNPLSAGKRKR